MNSQDEAWLQWYMRLKTDRVKRRMGLLRPDEGTMALDDRLQLMFDRGEIPNNKPVNEESVRERLRLVRRENKK